MRSQQPLESQRADFYALHVAPITASRLHGSQPLVHGIQQVTHVVISENGIGLRIGFRGLRLEYELLGSCLTGVSELIMCSFSTMCNRCLGVSGGWHDMVADEWSATMTLDHRRVADAGKR